ncbi:caspase family protein [Candidatus Woesearchaeota archaeon]|nr:caspase family protein [Candidatus Woesearchaeota archaeon]
MPKKAMLERQDKSGHEVNGAKQIVIIDGITHLGRTYEVKDHHARKTPQALHDATIAIFIECEGVSRNHAVVYPPDDRMSTFSIQDLKSLNGTYINDPNNGTGINKLSRKVSASERIPLRDKNVVMLSDAISFSFTEIEQTTKNYGLMVGHYGGNLKGTLNDVRKLKGEFEKRDFSIDELIDEQATPQNILAKLEVMKRYVTDDSIFLFYYAGHSSPGGALQVEKTSEIKILRPQDLLDALMDFRGQKLVILDSCYSSDLAKYSLPPRTVLIGMGGPAYEGHIPSMAYAKKIDTGPEKGEGNIMGYCSRALYKILRDNQSTIDVSALADKIREDTRIRVHHQNVVCKAMTQIKLSSIHHMPNKN